MSNLWEPEKIVLGVSRATSGVEVVDPDTAQTERIVHLPSDQGVYAMDMSADGMSLAVGTKTGFLYWLEKQTPSEMSNEFTTQKLIQGSSILSVCFLDRFNLATSDVASRCLIWLLGQNKKCERLATQGKVICALFKLDEDRLAGVSLDGKLVVWELNNRKVAEIIEIPKPPPLSALVKPVYWSARESWVWPAREGLITIYQAHGNQIKTISAHDSNFYACAIVADKLATIGRTDCCLKLWAVDSQEVVGCYEAPKGVISMTAWGDRDWQILIIKDSGGAGIYSLAKNGLELIRPLADQHYRTSSGPDVHKYKARIRQARTHAAEDLKLQIKGKIARRQWDGLGDLYRQLVALGFENMCLLLKAQAEAAKENIPGELQAYKELDCVLGQNRTETWVYLRRYAHLLEKTWQLQSSYAIYTRLSKTGNDKKQYTDEINGLSDHLQAIEKGRYVIDSSIGIDTLLESAGVLEEPFSGRYLLRQDGPAVNFTIHISEDDIIRPYQELCRKKPNQPLPSAQAESLDWLSDRGSEQVQVISFAGPDGDILEGLEFGIKLIKSGQHTVLAPMILFNAGEKPANISTADHNRLLFEKLSQINSGPTPNAWLRMVRANVNYVIRQLITKESSRNSLVGSHRKA